MMDVQITGIKGQGDASEEYVYLVVKNDCDIGKYMIADTTYTATGSVSNKLRHIYWFPGKKVKAGDAVVLRTGQGTNTTADLKGGGTLHRFYWNLKSAVWNDEGDAAVLLHAAQWSHHKAR